jgi:hypothetical protein
MMEKKNRIGEKYNKLLIIGDAPSKKEPSGRIVKRVIVRCDCGVEKEIGYKDIKRNKIKSCGCLNLPKHKIIEGERFGNWTVLSEGEKRVHKSSSERTALCQCVCGTTKEMIFKFLIKSNSIGCGCLREEKIKKEKIIPKDTEEEQWRQSLNYPEYYISNKSRLFHYKSQVYTNQKTVHERAGKPNIILKDEIYKTFVKDFDSSLYKLIDDDGELRLIEKGTKRVKTLKSRYCSIVSRCTREKAKDYKNYGGRGIKVEESFNTFYKFFMWSINNGFEENLEIDRIDNNGNYSSDNCRWVTRTENNQNTRRNVLNWDLVNEIRNSNLSDVEMGKLVGCEASYIKDVRAFKVWK